MTDKLTLKKLLDSLPKDVATRVRELLPNGMRMSAEHARLDRFRARMRLRSLGTGVWRGKDISGEQIHIEMKADSVAFEQSRVELHVDVELDIQVPALRKPKVYKLGPVHESVATPALPRINISSLAKELSACFVLSSVHADEVTADVAPIKDVDAGIAYVEAIDVEKFSAPSDGVAFANILLGPMSMKSLGADGQAVKSHAERVGVETEAKAKGVVLEGAKIVGGRARAAEGDDLNLGFEVQLPELAIKTFPKMPSAIDRLVTRLSVRIMPKVRFQIGRLKLDGMSLTTRVGSLTIGSLAIPIDVKGAELEDIELHGMGLENVVIDEEG